MTMTKTLPWAVALHIVFLGALLAAGGGALSYGGASGRGLMIVSLAENISQMAAPLAKTNETNETNASRREITRPLRETAKPAARKETIPPIHSRSIAQTQPDVKTKTVAQPPAISGKPQTGALQANRSLIPSAPFPRMQTSPQTRMHPMPMRRVTVWNPWTWMDSGFEKKAAFLTDARKTIRAMITGEMKKAGGGFDGEEAGVIISYGPDG
ncbi:MAG: hypothetical protein M0Z58_09380, partial [Nitrospiraceae bacterium]|nr:hypothetical protein [Nitrospiraceae bacterium]